MDEGGLRRRLFSGAGARGLEGAEKPPLILGKRGLALSQKKGYIPFFALKK